MLCHRSLPIHCYVRCGLLDFFCWITYPRCFAHIAAHCCILVGMYRKHPVLLRCLLFFLDMAINTLALHSYILFCQFIAKCFWDQKATLPVYHVVIGSCRMRGPHYVTWKEALTQSSCILMNLIPKERERVHRTQILFHSTKYMNVLHHVFRCVTWYTMVGYSANTLIKRFQKVAAICSSWSDQCHWDAMATEIQAWYSPCGFCLENKQINTGHNLSKGTCSEAGCAPTYV